MTDQSSRDSDLEGNMRKVGEAATGKMSPADKPSGQSQAAGFSLPFGLGKKKKDKEVKADAAPTPAAPPPAAPAAEAPKPARTHTVKKGDTLWDIAASYYGDGQQYQKIAKANNIANPNVINIGTTLTIPE